MHMYQKTDQELLEQYARKKDNRILGELLQRYTLLLFGVCMKYLKSEEESRDAVQQIYLKVITELPKYKIDHFKAWLYMVAKNHCLMKLRERKSGKGTALELSDTHAAVPAEDRTIDLKIEKEKKLQLMEASLEELQKDQQICLKLFYLEKKSYQEIAEERGYTLLQVKSYIQNGKRNLKILIEKKLNSNHY
jgi:RNA polymerase sigma factor (sigma-70 family)